MTLVYRGQAYTTSNNAASVNCHTTFTYRGQSYQRSNTNTIVTTPKNKLIYRGVPYVQPESTTVKGLTPTVA